MNEFIQNLSNPESFKYITHTIEDNKISMSVNKFDWINYDRTTYQRNKTYKIIDDYIVCDDLNLILKVDHMLYKSFPCIIGSIAKLTANETLLEKTNGNKFSISSPVHW